MLTSKKEEKICKKYSTRDDTGYVHCSECPLVKDKGYLMCKANSHYNRHMKEWEPDY